MLVCFYKFLLSGVVKYAIVFGLRSTDSENAVKSKITFKKTDEVMQQCCQMCVAGLHKLKIESF